MTRRHVVRAAVAAGLASVTLTGCEPASALDLVIETSDWNGWNPDHEPTVQTARLGVALGASITVQAVGELTITVTTIDTSGVTVSFSTPLAPNKGTGYDMGRLVPRGRVPLTRSTTFSTPTMDAGVHVTLSLEPR